MTSLSASRSLDNAGSEATPKGALPTFMATNIKANPISSPAWFIASRALESQNDPKIPSDREEVGKGCGWSSGSGCLKPEFIEEHRLGAKLGSDEDVRVYLPTPIEAQVRCHVP